MDAEKVKIMKNIFVLLLLTICSCAQTLPDAPEPQSTGAAGLLAGGLERQTLPHAPIPQSTKHLHAMSIGFVALTATGVVSKIVAIKESERCDAGGFIETNATFRDSHGNFTPRKAYAVVLSLYAGTAALTLWGRHKALVEHRTKLAKIVMIPQAIVTGVMVENAMHEVRLCR